MVMKMRACAGNRFKNNTDPSRKSKYNLIPPLQRMIQQYESMITRDMTHCDVTACWEVAAQRRHDRLDFPPCATRDVG